jgi:hypothetical protein
MKQSNYEAMRRIDGQIKRLAVGWVNFYCCHGVGHRISNGKLGLVLKLLQSFISASGGGGGG